MEEEGWGKGDIDNKADKYKASRAYTTLMWQSGLEVTLEWEGEHTGGVHCTRSWGLEKSHESIRQTHFYQQNGMSPVTENNNIHGLSLYEADCSMNDKKY